MDLIAELLILLGAVLALIAGFGQLRFNDVFVRMHVATKPATLGLALVLIGSLITIEGVDPAVKLVLAIFLQFLTAPVAGHLIGRAAYAAGAAEGAGLVIDELAEAASADDPDDLVGVDEHAVDAQIDAAAPDER